MGRTPPPIFSGVPPQERVSAQDWGGAFTALVILEVFAMILVIHALRENKKKRGKFSTAEITDAE